ncbi:MAG: ATP-binding protein [Solirubrobacterales bacterium]
MSEPKLDLVLPARAENVIVVRQAITGLGEALGMPGERVDDLKTVVTEACNNAVLHAYDDEPGPMRISASADDDSVAVTVSDSGVGFRPRGGEGEASLGLGLPLIASLSDSFEISGGAGGGTSVRVRLALPSGHVEAPDADAPAAVPAELKVAIGPGAMVRPVIARVLGALAARAEFPVERLSDTVLIGDAVSAHTGDDFAEGRTEIAVADGDGTLDVRVGPLVEGGGRRLLEQMDLPGEEGSLRALARSMEIVSGETADGHSAEYLVFAVGSD